MALRRYQLSRAILVVALIVSAPCSGARVQKHSWGWPTLRRLAFGGNDAENCFRGHPPGEFATYLVDMLRDHTTARKTQGNIRSVIHSEATEGVFNQACVATLWNESYAVLPSRRKRTGRFRFSEYAAALYTKLLEMSKDEVTPLKRQVLYYGTGMRKKRTLRARLFGPLLYLTNSTRKRTGFRARLLGSQQTALDIVRSVASHGFEYASDIAYYGPGVYMTANYTHAKARAGCDGAVIEAHVFGSEVGDMSAQIWSYHSSFNWRIVEEPVLIFPRRYSLLDEEGNVFVPSD